MDKLYGIKMVHIKNNHEKQYWFDNPTDRENFAKGFSKLEYLLEYQMKDQMEWNFDTRD